MRRLLSAVLAASGIWGAYWFVGATALERAARDWLASAAPRVQAAGADVAGFPNRFDLTLTDLRVGEAGSVVWQAVFLQLFALSYKPWHLIAAFPPEQRVTLPDGTVLIVTADKLQASLVVTPSTAVALDRIVVAGNGLGLRAEDRPGMTLDALRFATRRDATRTDTHEIGLEVNGLRPDQGLLAAPPDRPLPPGDVTMRLDALIGFSAPLDRFAGETQPMPILIDLKEARAVWGDIVIEATGRIVPDAAGLAEGQIDIGLSGWDSAIALAVATGALRPEIAPTWAELARRLAEASPTSGRIELPLVFADGRMRLGPLPLGRAPRLLP